MRSVNEWFGEYSKDHKYPLNRIIHGICVPAILWSVIATLWVIPVPASLGRPGFWCGMAMIGAFAFYWRMSRSRHRGCTPLVLHGSGQSFDRPGVAGRKADAAVEYPLLTAKRATVFSESFEWELVC